MKLSSFFSDFRGLKYSSYQLFEATFQQFFSCLNFSFGHKTPRGLNQAQTFCTHFWDRKQLFELLESRQNSRLSKKLKFYFFDFFKRKIHKQVRKLRTRLFLHQSETQFRGLRRRRLRPEIAARWRCLSLIKKMTAHYNSQFFVSLHYCFHWET